MPVGKTQGENWKILTNFEIKREGVWEFLKAENENGKMENGKRLILFCLSLLLCGVEQRVWAVLGFNEFFHPSMREKVHGELGVRRRIQEFPGKKL